VNRRDYLKKFIKELKSIREFVGDNYYNYCNEILYWQWISTLDAVIYDYEQELSGLPITTFDQEYKQIEKMLIESRSKSEKFNKSILNISKVLKQCEE
jgi:hypothetical protein